LCLGVSLNLLRSPTRRFSVDGALGSLFIGPFILVEAYLYRRKKGTWYEWKNQTRRRRGDHAISPEEQKHWKSEALRARLSQGSQPRADHGSRTRLFEDNNAGEAVSRAALLMTVADQFEQSGKREAADRCYVQITERFADSPQAREASRRLASATND
jgi:hypothetical protein